MISWSSTHGRGWRGSYCRVFLRGENKNKGSLAPLLYILTLSHQRGDETLSILCIAARCSPKITLAAAAHLLVEDYQNQTRFGARSAPLPRLSPEIGYHEVPNLR